MADTAAGRFWGFLRWGGLRSWRRADAAPALPAPRADAAASSATQHSVDNGGLVNPLSGLGTVNDKGAAARPNTARVPLSGAELEALYLYTGARRLVDIVPGDATRKGWTVGAPELEGNPFATADARLGIPGALREADVLARVFGRSAIWPVVDDGATDLSQPLDPARVTAVHNLVVLEQQEFTPVRYEGNPESPGYRQPSLYQVSPVAGGAVLGSGMVHASRLLILQGAYLPPQARYRNRGAGLSVLEAWWDALRNDTSIGQAGAFAAQELSIFYIQLAQVAAATSKEKGSLLTRLRAANVSKSMANALLLMPGEKAGRIALNLAGFKDLSSDAQKRLAAATGYPLAVLYGEAPSGLNTDGESHRKIWAQLIADHQQDKYVGPLRTLYDCLWAAEYGAIPEGWTLTFNPLDELTEQERADLEDTHAATDATRIQSGVITPDEARSRFTDDGYQSQITLADSAAPGADPARADALASQITASQRRARVRVPAAARRAARKALAWRKQHPTKIKGMTAAGWDRARQIAQGTLTGQDLIEINAWHARHRRGAGVKPALKKTPWRDPAHVGHLGWGGEAMARFAARQVARLARTTADAAPDPRTDTHPDSTILALPLPPEAGFPALVSRLRSFLPDLVVEDWGHVTVLYLGRLPASRVAAVDRIARETVAAFLAEWRGPMGLEVHRLGHFGPPDADEIPIVLDYYAYGLERLQDRLLRALSHLTTTPQHDRFRPHATGGHLPRPLTPAESAALLAIQPELVMGVGDWTPTVMDLRRGGETIAVYPLVTARLDGGEE